MKINKMIYYIFIQIYSDVQQNVNLADRGQCPETIG